MLIKNITIQSATHVPHRMRKKLHTGYLTCYCPSAFSIEQPGADIKMTEKQRKQPVVLT